MLLYLVRHGCTDMNGLGLLQGNLDTPLNQIGRTQSEKLAEHLRLVPFREAWSSDLKPATETAEIVLKYHPKVVLNLDPRLRERYFGVTPGQLIRTPSGPDAESLEDLEARLRDWITSLISSHTPTSSAAGTPRTPIAPTDPGSGAVLVVTHRYCLHALLRLFRASLLTPTSPIATNGNVNCEAYSFPLLPESGFPEILLEDSEGSLERKTIENTAVAILRVWWEEASRFGEPMVCRGRLEAWGSTDHLVEED